MTVAPYFVGWFMVFFQAMHSDKTKDRGYHVMLSCFVAFSGYIILAAAGNKSVGAAYFALFLVVGGNYSLFPLVMYVRGEPFLNFSIFIFITGAGELTLWLRLRNVVLEQPSSFLFQTASPCKCLNAQYQRYQCLQDIFLHSASPQIYFDDYDNFRIGHGISAVYV